MKKQIVKCVIGVLLTTNIITGYQFISVYHKQQKEITKQEKLIDELKIINSNRNNLIKQKRTEITELESKVKLLESELNELKGELP